MARVTVEDCVEKVTNRFDLVMMAAQRARSISAGAQLSVDRDNDKNPVVALREIADETVELAALREGLIKGQQRQVEFDEPEPDEDDEPTGDNLEAALAAEQGEAAPAEEIAEDVLSVQDDAAALDQGGEVVAEAGYEDVDVSSED